MTIDRGRGPALVFLHHFGGSARSWTRVIDRLVDDCRCIAPDLPGFGADCDRQGPFTTAAAADATIALVDGFELDDFILVGHSMGGKIAMAIAARRPAGLRRLVLLAPSPPPPEPISDEDRAHLLASWGNRAAMAAIVVKIAARPIGPADREQLVADMLLASEAAWRAWLTDGSREDIGEALDEIRVPVTILSGSDDRTIPAEVLRRDIAERLTDARLEIIAGAGHLLPVEASEEVAAIILRCRAASYAK